mmetsp:Transcript_92764/g.162249  ORF Transcript_92764/g.162249 Transcript_92764/m.162249 type:complete len:423 (+) Transcript_92764:2-1270(+)
MQADCYFTKRDIIKNLDQDHTPVEPKDGAPVCLLYFKWVPPVSASWPIVVSPQPHPANWRTVIRITQEYGRGHECRFQWHAIMSFVAAVFIILQFPKYWIRWVATTCLGQLSTVYRRVLFKPFSVSAAFAQLGARLICASASYVDLIHWDEVKRSGQRKEGVPNWRIRERLQKAFGSEFEHLNPEHVDRFIAMCSYGSQFGSMHSEHTMDIFHATSMSCQDFCAACVSDEVVDFHDVVELCDAKRTRGCLESCFTPTHLRFFINASIAQSNLQEQEATIEEEREQEHQALIHVLDQHATLSQQNQEFLPQLEHLKKSFSNVDALTRAQSGLERKPTLRSESTLGQTPPFLHQAQSQSSFAGLNTLSMRPVNTISSEAAPQSGDTSGGLPQSSERISGKYARSDRLQHATFKARSTSSLRNEK